MYTGWGGREGGGHCNVGQDGLPQSKESMNDPARARAPEAAAFAVPEKGAHLQPLHPIVRC